MEFNKRSSFVKSHYKGELGEHQMIIDYANKLNISIRDAEQTPYNDAWLLLYNEARSHELQLNQDAETIRQSKLNR